MTKMNALIKAKAERGLKLVQVDKPKIKEGFALVKIKKTSICGTDLHIYEWDPWSQKTIKPGQIIGHEFSGVIEDIKGNTTFKKGDFVTAEGHIVCKECRNCRSGRETSCKYTFGIGVNIDGIFAEYALIPITNLVAVDKCVDSRVVSFMDAFGNATQTALAYPLVGEDVLITGAGPIGIMAAAVAKFCGAKNVVITNRSEYRLELARKVVPGVVAISPQKEPIPEVMKRLGIKEGFDIGLEMSGASQALNDMIDNMVCGGKIALLGVHKPDTMIDWNKVVFKTLTMKGIYGREMYDGWYKMNAMLCSGLDLTPLITHEFPYQKFEEAFELGLSGKCGKIVLSWD
ncbi:MAG: L-threonine 3-dehydrogenase [Firmicutes bacterium]|nr:L-threonine 3-dehydrogenase [Bacillota bacterium]